MFSTFPGTRAKNTISKVVLPPGGNNCRKKENTNKLLLAKLSIITCVRYFVKMFDLTTVLKEPSPIASDIFQTLWDFGIRRKLVFSLITAGEFCS